MSDNEMDYDDLKQAHEETLKSVDFLRPSLIVQKLS